MRSDRPLTLLLCSLIVIAAWLVVVTGGSDAATLATAVVTTLLCAAIALHHVRGPSRRFAVASPRGPIPRDESAEFRRSLFNLCAALKLGLRYCEDHLDTEPEALIEQLQRMSDNINVFVCQITRPVRFCERALWPWRPRSRWPWRVNPHGRTPN